MAEVRQWSAQDLFPINLEPQKIELVESWLAFSLLLFPESDSSLIGMGKWGGVEEGWRMSVYMAGFGKGKAKILAAISALQLMYSGGFLFCNFVRSLASERCCFLLLLQGAVTGKGESFWRRGSRQGEGGE